MKKKFLLIIGLLLLALISVYFIIPQWIVTKCTINVDAADRNVAKFITSKRQWTKWWPGKHIAGDSSQFTYKDISFTLNESTNSAMRVQVKSGDVILNSQVTYLGVEEGVTAITWSSEKQSSINPVKRIAEFVSIKNTEGKLNELLAHFKTFMQTDSNVYGIHVKLAKVKDPVVIAKNSSSKTYPTTATVYKLIDELQKEIKLKDAKQVDVPMLNINRVDNGDYTMMVALPIDKWIKPDATSVMNKLVKNANLLSTEVKGGRQTIDKAFDALKHYQRDHRLITIAMPYEMIITNRTAEQDTSKWVTRLYLPIL